jgi:hypothetical protein
VPRPLSTGTFARLEAKSDGEWMVQTMPADASTKSYTCPGCSQPVAVGSAHVVTWPREASIGSTSAVEERRHWHTSCWQRRR